MTMNMRKHAILAAAIAAALAAAPAFAGGTAPQATGTGGYSSVCTDFTGAGCAPLAQFDAAQATGFASAALGWYSTASGTGALALGDFSIASGSGSTAVGTSATASGDASTALGGSANASGDQATALGTAAQATGFEGTAVGTGAQATSGATTAVGDGAAASGAGSTAVGTLAQATGFNGTAIGQNAAAIGDGTVALGSGSVANQPDTVSVGDASTGLTRQVTNVAAGTQATDAANVGQLDAGLAGANLYTDQQFNLLGQRIGTLDTRISTAMAMSAAQSTLLGACDPAALHCITTAVGFSGGMGAVAFGYRQRTGSYGAITASASLSQHDAAVGIGWGASW